MPDEDGRHSSSGTRLAKTPGATTRRSLLLGAAATGIGAGSAAFALARGLGGSAATSDRKPGRSGASISAAPHGSRPLRTRPPALQEPIVIDLSEFDPSGPLPGWDGLRAGQTAQGTFPQDRDLLVLGHRSRTWTGGGFVRGGRNVHWVGGCYSQGLWLRNFVGTGCVEGALVRAPFAPDGRESGDGVALVPDSTTNGRSDIMVLNCRTENVDGFLDGAHGDCFQLPSSYDPPGGYSSTPRTVTIERFTGTTGYQGLFLANQHFDSRGYQVSCRLLRLMDVNLRKTRQTILGSLGRREEGLVILLYLADPTDVLRGDRPYPRVFENVHLEPWSNEGIAGCVFPTFGSPPNSWTGETLAPLLSRDGSAASFPSALRVKGTVKLGPHRDGDFATEAGPGGFGGLDTPGIGYESPGYA